MAQNKEIPELSVEEITSVLVQIKQLLEKQPSLADQVISMEVAGKEVNKKMGEIVRAMETYVENKDVEEYLRTMREA